MSLLDSEREFLGTLVATFPGSRWIGGDPLREDAKTRQLELGHVEPEREPEPTWADWSKDRPGKPRELPAGVAEWAREHGIRTKS